MKAILSALLDAIDLAKSEHPDLASYPRLIGVVISLKERDSTKLNEWISLLEDKNTPMKDIMMVGNKWDNSLDESIAYYIEITDELKYGLSTSIEAIGY